MFYLPRISFRSITGILLIINIIVFVLINILSPGIAAYLFIAMPGQLTP
jgi:hypothetical protein